VIRISGGEVYKKRFFGQEEYAENANIYVLDLATVKWSCLID
jgi:hypothetical protein